MLGQSGAGEQADRVLCRYSTFSPLPPSPPLGEVAQEKTKRMKSSSCKTEKAPKPPAPRRAAKDTGRVGPRGARQGLGTGRYGPGSGGGRVARFRSPDGGCCTGCSLERRA